MPSDQQTYRRNELYRQARQFLSAILADGPQPYSTIVARATEAGISLASLLTAKRALRVESRKVNKRAPCGTSQPPPSHLIALAA